MRVKDAAFMDRHDLRRMSEAELAELGVRILDRNGLMLECRNCGETWEPQLDAGGKLPAGYWVCPLKCNEKAAV